MLSRREFAQLLLWGSVETTLSRAESSPLLRFGIIGDSGTGEEPQKRVAAAMERFQARHPWEFVLMLGDNIYDKGDPKDFDLKFKNVYRNLMADGVRFHAALGNHDRIHPASRRGMAQVEDEAFGYVGKVDEYVFEAGPKVTAGRRLARFICLNSDAWVEAIQKDREPELRFRLRRLRGWLAYSDRYRWNILYAHHPLYSYTKKPFWGLTSRGHGPSLELRAVLEPELVGRVDVCLAGHEHFYQKIRPQKGIDHIISGGAGKLRKGALTDHAEVEFAAVEYHFLDVELSEASFKYQAVNDEGRVIHSGVIAKGG